jgi:hypothetical protein
MNKEALPAGVDLETITFTFSQESNCVDGRSDEYEELIIEAKSSIGISRDDGAFFVIKTQQWAVESGEEFQKLIDTCNASVNAFLKKQ